MKAVLRATLFAICACTCLSRAHAQDDKVSNGMRNGRFWLGAGFELRLAYVAGLVDAQQFTGTYIGCDCSWKEMVDGVTAFYDSDPSYLRLPVQVALDVFMFRKRGAPNDQIDEYISAALRAPRREGTLPSQPATPPPTVVPLVLNDVGFMQNNSVFGCKGTLTIDSTLFQWRSGPKCGDDFDVPVTLGDLVQIEFDHAAMGVNVWLASAASGTPLHFSMTLPRAQRLSRHLFSTRPTLQQQCFFVKGIGSNREKSSFDCRAW